MLWGRVSDSRCGASTMVTGGTRALLLRLRLMLGDDCQLSAEREEAASNHGNNYF